MLDRGDERRDAVAAYIRDVNAIEVRHSAELKEANAAYRRLDFGAEAPAKQAPDLARAETAVRSLRAAIRALTPPPEAVKLDRLLVRLADAQLAFTRDVSALSDYLPALARNERVVATTTERLRRELAAAKRDDDRSARAFARYSARLREVAREIGALEGPASLASAQSARVEDMRALARISQRVADALGGDDGLEAERASRDLARAAAGAAVPAASRRDFVAEYNRRLRALGALRRAVDRERDRLDISVD